MQLVHYVQYSRMHALLIANEAVHHLVEKQPTVKTLIPTELDIVQTFYDIGFAIPVGTLKKSELYHA